MFCSEVILCFSLVSLTHRLLHAKRDVVTVLPIICAICINTYAIATLLVHQTVTLGGAYERGRISSVGLHTASFVAVGGRPAAAASAYAIRASEVTTLRRYTNRFIIIIMIIIRGRGITCPVSCRRRK